MARKSQNQKEPTLLPERALRALSQQLVELQNLKNRPFQEAESERDEWEHLTENIIEATFGNPSSQLSRFYSARNSGIYLMGGISNIQKQKNYNEEIQDLESLLKALVSALRLQLPEEETKGVYEPGEEYNFYRDLTSIIQAATRDILFVDAYLDEDLFNLYVSKIPSTLNVRILTNNVRPNVNTVARMFAKKQQIQLRSSSDIHDRHIFIDQRGWAFGQSIKDAATKKPTYMIELNGPALKATKDIHDQIWAAATSII
jgi:hypothetical protein